jgi:hypothetical protein
VKTKSARRSMASSFDEGGHATASWSFQEITPQ